MLKRYSHHLQIERLYRQSGNMVSAKHAARTRMNIGSHGINNLNNIIGSQIKANDDVTLKAEDQINLIAVQNVDTLKSKNSSSSASLGVSFGTDGLLFTAGASGNKGKTKGNGSTWTETQIQSGTDTNVIGSQVIANVGINGQGNLNIESLQDSNQYQDKQQSIGGSVSVGYGKMGGSFNYSDSKTKSNYASVNEQAGFFAGNGGFQANVAGNTKLLAAVIASSEQAMRDNQNRLTTQTLTIRNIENSAKYKASGMSIGGGYSISGGKVGLQQPVGTLATTQGANVTKSIGWGSLSDDTNSVTVSGISGGNISITDNTQQQNLTGQDTATTVATLNRECIPKSLQAQMHGAIPQPLTAQ
jgi:filamentous hemagglutinin